MEGKLRTIKVLVKISKLQKGNTIYVSYKCNGREDTFLLSWYVTNSLSTSTNPRKGWLSDARDIGLRAFIRWLFWWLWCGGNFGRWGKRNILTFFFSALIVPQMPWGAIFHCPRPVLQTPALGSLSPSSPLSSSSPSSSPSSSWWAIFHCPRPVLQTLGSGNFHSREQIPNMSKLLVVDTNPEDFFQIRWSRSSCILPPLHHPPRRLVFPPHRWNNWTLWNLFIFFSKLKIVFHSHFPGWLVGSPLLSVIGPAVQKNGQNNSGINKKEIISILSTSHLKVWCSHSEWIERVARCAQTRQCAGGRLFYGNIKQFEIQASLNYPKLSGLTLQPVVPCPRQVSARPAQRMGNCCGSVSNANNWLFFFFFKEHSGQGDKDICKLAWKWEEDRPTPYLGSGSQCILPDETMTNWFNPIPLITP